MKQLENASFMKAPQSFAGMDALLGGMDLPNPNSIQKCEVDLPLHNKEGEGATDREQRSLDIISEGIAAAVQQDRNARGLSQCNSGGLIWKSSHDRLPSVQSQDNQKNLPIIQLHSAGI